MPLLLTLKKQGEHELLNLQIEILRDYKYVPYNKKVKNSHYIRGKRMSGKGQGSIIKIKRNRTATVDDSMENLEQYDIAGNYVK